MTKDELIAEIGGILASARIAVATHVNARLLDAYWNVGRLIVQYEQSNNIRAEYGKQTLKEVSRRLVREVGKGFSVSNLQFMRRLFLAYPKQQTVSV